MKEWDSRPKEQSKPLNVDLFHSVWTNYHVDYINLFYKEYLSFRIKDLTSINVKNLKPIVNGSLITGQLYIFFFFSPFPPYFDLS